MSDTKKAVKICTFCLYPSSTSAPFIISPKNWGLLFGNELSPITSKDFLLSYWAGEKLFKTGTSLSSVA